METMGNNKRTHYCGSLRKENAGEEVCVTGFVQNRRELSGLTFVVLRDRTGLLQLSFSKEENEALYEKANSVRNEYVLMVKGKVKIRESVNPNMETGDIEIVADDLRILSKAHTPPFEIRDDLTANEELRLKYRYLDLRRTPMQEIFKTRHRITKSTRDYFDENGFIEFETPILTKSTPEGARDYLVPSRVHGGSFYALPQSPQQYKQLLMMAGFDRYMQIAKCFRDEDLRADRQPEFTQIDVEMSYIDEDDIMTLAEGYIKRLFKDVRGEILPDAPFRRISYDEAMERFGSDKPDTRFGLELISLRDTLKNSEFKVFSSPLQTEEGYVGAINAKGLADKYSRKAIDRLTKEVQGLGAKGLAYLRLTEDGETSSYEKFLSEEERLAVRAKTDAQTGDVLFLVGDTNGEKAMQILGLLRGMIAKEHALYDKNSFDMLWIVDFPLYEYSEEEDRLVSAHHPFTMPKEEDIPLLKTNPRKARARAYDMVINGYEVGGGSIRINDPDIQEAMFESLGFTPEAARERFGYLLEALSYGVPPHGGIAYGLDRLVMIFTGTDNIKDVIAFPKLQNASDPMTGSPAPVDTLQLDELSLCVKKEKV